MFTRLCFILALYAASADRRREVKDPLAGNYAKKRCYKLDLTVFYRIPGGLTLSNAQVTKKMTGAFNFLSVILGLYSDCNDVRMSMVDVAQSSPGQSNVVIRGTVLFDASDGVPDSEVDSRLSGCIERAISNKAFLDSNLPRIQNYRAYNKSTISTKRSCCGGVTPPPCCSAGSTNVSKSLCACIPGHYSPTFGQNCRRCPVDSYQPNYGQTTCSRCAQGTRTFNKTGLSSSSDCSDTNPIYIQIRSAEYILKDVTAGSVVATVNASGNFEVLVKPLLYNIESVTSKPSYKNNRKDSRIGETQLPTQQCLSVGKNPPSSFFCIRHYTGAVEITSDFKWRAGDEFELTVHVTDSDPRGKTGNYGKIRLVSKDVCRDIQSLYSKVQENCPRNGLVELTDIGPYPKQKLNISTSSVTSIIQAKVKLSYLENLQTDTTYSMKLIGTNIEKEISFRVDANRTYDVIFVQPLIIQSSLSGLTVELSANDRYFNFDRAETIILYGVPKNPVCPGTNCLSPLVQWQTALNNLSNQGSVGCSRDPQHLRLRFAACFAAPTITLNPVSKKVKLGTKIEFVCNATASLDMEVMWYKDGLAIDRAAERRLRVTADQYDKQGYYHCEFRTAYERVATKPALLVLTDVLTTVVKFQIINKSYKRRASVREDFNVVFVRNFENHLTDSESRWTYSVTFRGFSNWNDKLGVDVVVYSPAAKLNIDEYYTSLGTSIKEGVKTGFSTKSVFSKKSLVIRNAPIEVDINTKEGNGKAIEVDINTKEDNGKENCLSEKTGKENIKGIFQWPLVPIGQDAPPVSCINGPVGTQAKRHCGGNFSAGGVWSDPDVSDCNYKSKSTQELDQLSKKPIDESNVKSVSQEVRNLTASVPPERMSEADASLTADLLEKIVAVDGALGEISDDVVDIVDKMMQIDEDTLLESQKTSEASTKFIRTMDKIAENLPLSPNETSRLLVSPNVAVQTNRVKPASFRGMLYGATKPSGDKGMTADNILTKEPTSQDDVEVSVTLPPDLFESVAIGNSDDASVGFIVYQNSKFFQLVSDDNEESTSSFVNSRVISTSVQGVTVENLTNPLQLVFRPLRSQTSGSPVGAYWDMLAAGGQGNFSTRGCKVVSPPNSDLIKVESDHMTNFAVLFSASGPGQETLDDGHRQALSIITYVGCAISLAGILLTLLTYTMFGNLRKSNQQTILICLCITLAALLIAFIAGVGRTECLPACRAVAVLLHYLALATLAWMGVEGYNMYQSFIQVMGTYQSKFMRKASLVAWGAPILIVVPTVAAATRYYGNDEACVLHGLPFYAAMFAPVLLIILVNFVIFFMVVYSLGKSGALFSAEKKSTTYQSCRTSISILVLLGLTWVFGALAIGHARLLFEYLFCIFNSLQGLFIFFFHCLRHQEVRSQWKWFLMGRGISYQASKSDSYPRSRGIGESSSGVPRDVKPTLFSLRTSKRRKDTVSTDPGNSAFNLSTNHSSKETA